MGTLIPHAYDGSNRLLSLPATGQLTSYVKGDDGSRKAGVAWPETRFSDNQDGPITDHLTGLIWPQDAGCFAETLWSSALKDANQLASGACGLTDGSNVGHWRLPNVNELESLVDVSATNPAVSNPRSFAVLRRAYGQSKGSGLGVESDSVRGSMQTDRQAGTVIFVSNLSPEATVLQDIEAHGLLMQWARSIRAAVDLLNSAREKTVIVTELALADGNWSDLAKRVRCIDLSTPIVLVASFGTAELLWDALECGVDDILPGHLLASGLCQLLETQGAS